MVCLVVMGVASSCLDRPLVESRPDTSNLFVDQVEQRSIDKIDLLFMVDNSASMADKQDILREAVPVLVSRLTSPQCVDPVTRVPTGEKGPCLLGEPEFQAVADIHVGIVTSSLGAHGGSQCQPTSGYTPDDKAHLLGTIRPASGTTPGLAFDVSRTWNNTGFLAWDAGLRDVPPGLNDPGALRANFQDMIAAAGETGCGYEASLESWYRFLVDPEPPLNVIKDDTQHTARGSRLFTHADGSTTCEGCDLELLAQRKAFLRPDSLLAIVMLSDENDCSIRDDGAGWLVTTDSALGENQVRYPVRMPRATAACAHNPNDKCCRSCADASPTPAGCPALADDEICKTVVSGQSYAVWDALHDNASLRCFNEKQPSESKARAAFRERRRTGSDAGQWRLHFYRLLGRSARVGHAVADTGWGCVGKPMQRWAARPTQLAAGDRAANRVALDSTESGRKARPRSRHAACFASSCA
jgi:hypothetical protein